MILIDTSAWVEFLRGTRSAICNRVEELLDKETAICYAVRMEVLAGARDERHLHDLRRLLARATVLPTGPMHYDDAASLYRHCHREGEIGRKLADCLIGAVAIRADTPVIHTAADFDVLTRHTDLKIAT